MTMTSYDIHFSMLFLLAKQALSIVIELNSPFCNIFLHPLTFFIFRALKDFVRVKINLNPANSTICFPPASSLNIPSTLLLSPVLIQDG